MKTTNRMETMIRITELMQEYEGSNRYYETDRGYEMIAAKLEDEGVSHVDRMIKIHRRRMIVHRCADKHRMWTEK